MEKRSTKYLWWDLLSIWVKSRRTIYHLNQVYACLGLVCFVPSLYFFTKVTQMFLFSMELSRLVTNCVHIRYCSYEPLLCHHPSSIFPQNWKVGNFFCWKGVFNTLYSQHVHQHVYLVDSVIISLFVYVKKMMRRADLSSIIHAPQFQKEKSTESSPSISRWDMMILKKLNQTKRL